MSNEHPQTPSSGPPCRVLIVDDNELNVLLVKEILSRENFQIRAAGDAQQAIAAAAAFKPQLILMDLQLPGIDGLTLTRQLKSAADTRDIRIVILTAHKAEEVEGAVRAAGGDGLLTKPLDPASFGATVRSYLPPAVQEPTADA